jgi:hypothetical protein
MFLRKTEKNTNLYKVLLDIYIMPKKDLNETKSKSATVKGTIPLNQKEAIRKLIGVIGSNEQDVVGKIITLWLYNEGYLTNKNKKVKQDE